MEERGTTKTRWIVLKNGTTLCLRLLQLIERLKATVLGLVKKEVIEGVLERLCSTAHSVLDCFFVHLTRPVCTEEERSTFVSLTNSWCFYGASDYIFICCKQGNGEEQPEILSNYGEINCSHHANAACSGSGCISPSVRNSIAVVS